MRQWVKGRVQYVLHVKIKICLEKNDAERMRRPRAPLPERLDHQQLPVSVGSAKWTQRCSHWKVGPDLVDQIQWVSHTDIKVKGVSQEERVSAEERERVTEEKDWDHCMQTWNHQRTSWNLLSIRGLFIPPPNKTRNTTEKWIRTWLQTSQKGIKQENSCILCQRNTRQHHAYLISKSKKLDNDSRCGQKLKALSFWVSPHYNCLER